MRRGIGAETSARLLAVNRDRGHPPRTLQSVPLLPDDDAVAGFDNVGAGLQIARIHQERYLEAAETAPNAAIATGPRPPSTMQKLAFLKADYPTRRILENGTVIAVLC